MKPVRKKHFFPICSCGLEESSSDSPIGENLTDKQKTFFSKSKIYEKTIFVWKKFLKSFCLTRRLQNWQLVEKTTTRAERFLLNGQKLWRDTHFREPIFFFKIFPCAFDKRCQNLTTIGWNFSAQFKKEKNKPFSNFILQSLFYGHVESDFDQLTVIKSPKVGKVLSMSKIVKNTFYETITIRRRILPQSTVFKTLPKKN